MTEPRNDFLPSGSGVYGGRESIPATSKERKRSDTEAGDD